MPNGLYPIYGQYKKEQQSRREMLLDLLGKRLEMQTREQFYRTRPSELAREEEYRTGTEYKKAQLKELLETRGLEETKRTEFNTLKNGLLESNWFNPVEKGIIKATPVTQPQKLIDLLERKAEVWGFDPDDILKAKKIEKKLLPPEVEPSIAEKKWRLLSEDEKKAFARLDTPEGKVELEKELNKAKDPIQKLAILQSIIRGLEEGYIPDEEMESSIRNYIYNKMYEISESEKEFNKGLIKQPKFEGLYEPSKSTDWWGRKK